jgi:PTS system beta-glucosides-specific IIC component
MFKFKKKKEIVIASPLNGVVIPVSQINDPAFSEDVLGRGIGIRPIGAKRVVAPAKAKLNYMFDTGHAVSMISENGTELLIHIGIDTVKLKGRYFSAKKNSSDSVDVGDALIEFDAEGIKSEGFDDVVVIVVCNPTAFSEVRFAPPGSIKEGEPLVFLKE